MSDYLRPADRSNDTPERVIAQALLQILETMSTGQRLHDVTYKNDRIHDLLLALEYFIPEVICEVHADWKHESLDGVFALFVEKSGERTARIPGECILISDQTVVPLLLEIEVNPMGDKLNWFECRLGLLNHHGAMVRLPYQNSGTTPKLTELYHLDGREESINWAYHVSYGAKSV